MWVLNNGLKKRFYRVLLFSALFFSVSLCLYSDEKPLTREEVETWDRETLIEAVMLYDQLMTEINLSLIQTESYMEQQRQELNLQLKNLEEREALLILYEKEYENWTKNQKASYNNGFQTGATVSGVLFAFFGGLIVYNIK